MVYSMQWNNTEQYLELRLEKNPDMPQFTLPNSYLLRKVSLLQVYQNRELKDKLFSEWLERKEASYLSAM